MVIKFKKLSENAHIPTKNFKTDAGWDLYSSKERHLGNGMVSKISTDIAISIPEGYFGLIKDRSGMGSKGVHVFAGVIDSGFHGNIEVILFTNLGNPWPFEIRKGDRIAQLLILPVPDVEFQEVDELDKTERNEKGWGSSGQ